IEGWSDPINAGSTINSKYDEYYISFTNDGTMYFSSDVNAPENQKGNDFDIYAAKWKDGNFQKPEVLGKSVNTEAYEADVFVSPDESYLIFCANRADGLGRGDLYISFRNTDGTWTKSVNMGGLINTKGHELCPFVTYDGKYLFYSSNREIYWVSTDILMQYRPE
ncbi:MAG: hypothetical protein AAFO69_04610, partial [Bacteroidota bacterium]